MSKPSRNTTDLSHLIHKRLWERHRLFASGAVGALGALVPTLAAAGPTGGHVVAGSATISKPSHNGTVVTESSQSAVINWQQFSLGANQYVQFIQPDSSAVILNRVTGGNTTDIFGDIRANGQVFLINPNGILFGKGSTLDVSGLVASTQDISNSDFMRGDYTFTRGSGAPDASVVNQGSILTTRGGYVVLAGDYVENDGRIQAETGQVVMSASGGATLTLDHDQLISYAVDSATLERLAGVTNTGAITAEGGNVLMSADVANALTAGAVNRQGYNPALAIQEHVGKIVLAGLPDADSEVLNTGSISARSLQGQSGTIVLQAQGADIVNNGLLDVSATQAGVAGGAVVLHGNQVTHLLPESDIDASGVGTGKGGYVDLSGHDLAVNGRVATGKGGMLVLDPAQLNIVTGAGGGNTSPVNSIGTAFIAAALNAGSNVTLVATGSIHGVGNITATTGANAGNSRFQLVTGALTSCGAAFGQCIGVSSFPALTHNNGTINISGLTINMKGAFTADASQGLVTLGPVSADSGITVTGGQIQINGNLTAAIGIMNLAANRGVAPNAFIKTAPGVKLKAGSVSLSLTGSYGGVISIGTISAGNSVTLGLNYSTLFSPTSPEKIVTGSITGKTISIHAKGPKDSIDVNGSITAVNASGAAGVNITANGEGGNAIVKVNGNVTVSGKQISSSGSTLPFDMPIAAGFRAEAFGSGAGSHIAKVNGNVNVTAIGGHFSRNSGCECGPPTRSQKGTGGIAAAYLIATGSNGVASINGSVSVKGPDAHVGVLANTVKVNGNISVAASGHHVTRSVNGSGVSYNSSNSAGQATLQLGAGQVYVGSPSTPAAPTVVLSHKVTVAGDISVTGKGIADATFLASSVSAGNVTVSATAAKGTLKQKGVTTGVCTKFAADDCTDLNSIAFYQGIGRAALHAGAIDAGAADIRVSGGTTLGSGSGSPALTVKFGALSVNGVGRAAVAINGKAVATHAIGVTATKGTEKGKGSSQSGTTTVTTFKHTFSISGGDAEVKIRSGNSTSNHSGVLTQNGGPVVIAGNVSATGPAADVDIKGKTIKVAGTVTVAGSGSAVNSDTVVTGGRAFHTVLVGDEPTTVNLQGGVSGSVSVAGKISIKGPGLMGVIAVGGNVTLHGLSASASAVKAYNVLDTRVSATAQNLALGSIGLIVADVKAVGGKPAFTSASDVGDIVLKSKGNVDLPAEIKIGGNLIVQAGGDIAGSPNKLLSHFNAVQNTRVRANSHSGSNGGPSSGGQLPHLAVGANAVAMIAGGNIDLTGGQLNIGNGSLTAAVASAHGDSTLVAGLAGLGLAPATPNPNGFFKAGGNLILGGVKLTGTYLSLQGATVTVLGPVSVPTASLIQVAPANPASSIDIEDASIAGADTRVLTESATGGFNLSNQAFLSLFPGTTIAVGDAAEIGAVTLGANGPLNIGATNLIIDTLGPVTGLSTVISTGHVVSLLSILGPPVQPPTTSEIDPNASGSTTPNKKTDDTGPDATGAGGGGGTITEGNGGADNVCR